jgi:hypothetical protein
MRIGSVSNYGWPRYSIQLLEVSKLVVPHKNQIENSVSSLNLQKKLDFKFEN